MHEQFWHDRWEQNQLGFHEAEFNSFLVRHFQELSLKKNARVFVPLCGKTLDMHWLLSNGYKVAGAELSEIAIIQLFEELDVKPTIQEIGDLKHYQSPNIDIFVGDIFALNPDLLGHVDAIFDRGAFVALPDAMRLKYSKHLIEITKTAPQLLVTFEYDQNVVQGPPFAISKEEVEKHYADAHTLSKLPERVLEDGFRRAKPAAECGWILS